MSKTSSAEGGFGHNRTPTPPPDTIYEE